MVIRDTTTNGWILKAIKTEAKMRKLNLPNHACIVIICLSSHIHTHKGTAPKLKQNNMILEQEKKRNEDACKL